MGKYDQMQLQRGLKVYTEVCASCHGLRYVPLRTLADPGGPGYTEDEVRAYAAENFTVFDPELDDDREAKPSDHFPTVSGDGMGPDLSLMAKARAGFHGPYGTGLNQLFKGIGGAEYISAYLLGFTGEEAEVAGQFLYENMAFPTGWVQMAPQLEDGLIEYDDGTPATAEQMAHDVSAFLMWTAEPKMMARKQAGAVAVLLLVLLSSLLYLSNKKLWYPIKHGGKHADL
jgi:ubiquinol-cytochrome c reductase cytochrome c1 subunit